MDKNAYLEVNASQKPAIELLVSMGYTYISPEDCEKQRGSRYHVLLKDVLRGQILNIGYMLLMGTAVWFTVSSPALYTVFGFDTINYGFAYILVSIFLGLLQPLVSLITNANSRRAEYRADRQAVIEGYGEAMISAFKKLAKDNFSHLAPSKINVVLEYSHPPLDRRVKEVEKALKEQEK